MKTRPTLTPRQASRRGAAGVAAACGRRLERGIMLIECLVYISLLFVVLGFGYMAFYRSQDFAIGLRRNADDIVRALDAGERWRQDIRSARGPIRIEAGGGEEVLHIPQARGEVAYRLAGGELRRCAGERAPWLVVLPQVKSSHMQADVRTRITSWRWEIELSQTRKHARVRPRFTFEAVPPNPAVP